MAIPLIALAGAGVDYAVWMSARQAAQLAADAGALAAAASTVDTRAAMEKVVAGVIGPGLERHPGVVLSDVAYDETNRRVTVTMGGSIEPLFVQLVGVHSLPISAIAVAERATNGRLELAMVLDNTWSMSDSDGSGGTKIASLKTAANSLLTAIWDDDNDGIRVGLVPYANYVNVGVSNRYQPWMSVAADTSTTSTPQPRVCETKTVKSVCVAAPKKTCVRYVDGVAENFDCSDPATCTNQTVPPYQSCTGGGTPTTTRTTWWGCVLSRTPRNLRLSDAEPATPYVGIMATSQACMNPIIPLTDDEASVRSGINAMVPNIGTGYKPLTHIPSGMVWGINVLSNTQPFTQGEAYDPNNKEPRKALILMTDGDNTLRYNNGQHSPLSTAVATAATQKAATDTDTTTLCTYAKSKNIEVFVVSFGVLLPASNTMLRNCASDADHYYSAVNASELTRAFANIADRLRVVRITR